MRHPLCPFPIQNVVLGSLKPFFQLDHQVEISLYLPEPTALHHSRESSLFDFFHAVSVIPFLIVHIDSMHSPTYQCNIDSDNVI